MKFNAPGCVGAIPSPPLEAKFDSELHPPLLQALTQRGLLASGFPIGQLTEKLVLPVAPAETRGD